MQSSIQDSKDSKSNKFYNTNHYYNTNHWINIAPNKNKQCSKVQKLIKLQHKHEPHSNKEIWKSPHKKHHNSKTNKRIKLNKHSREEICKHPSKQSAKNQTFTIQITIKSRLTWEPNKINNGRKENIIVKPLHEDDW